MVKRRLRGQADLISAMILIAATLAIALAAYAYFSSSATAASSKQTLEIILAREKASVLISIDYMRLNDTYVDYYVSFKRAAGNNTPMLFVLVPGRIVNPDYIEVSGTLTLLQVEEMVPVNGLYQGFALTPFIRVPATQLRSPPGKAYIFDPPDREVDIYLVRLTMSAGEDMPGDLVKIRVDASTSTERPLLLVLAGINNQYYIVDAYSLGGW